MNAGNVRHADRQPIGHALWWVIALVLLVRLASLGLYPLSDTTESRYAEIARTMAQIGDWVTPWYQPGVPFWGKPPLSMWATAASFKLFGVDEWAARLPHVLAAVVVATLVWGWMRRRSDREALLTIALLSGAALFFVAAGAVMTDMALLVGTTMAMRGFWLAVHGGGRAPTLTLISGVAIGLLAKGPVALLLIGMPIVAWVAWTRRWRSTWAAVPWGRGAVALAALVVPWYALAEHRTPGFLDYFLVGEHWQRFMVSGWAGDRYGNAHASARGTIWLYALLAVMPWPVLVPLMSIGRRRHRIDDDVGDEDARWFKYLGLWAIAPCVLFTASRNILWTYVLPMLPAAAMLAATWLARDDRRLRIERGLAAGLVIVCILFGAVVSSRGVEGFESARDALRVVARAGGAFEHVAVVGPRQYSVSFYSAGRSLHLQDIPQLREWLDRPAPQGATRYVLLKPRQSRLLPPSLRARLQSRGRHGAYDLYADEALIPPAIGQGTPSGD